MTKKKIALISLLVLALLSVLTYYILGEEHPLVAIGVSFLILTKLKLIGISTLIWAKLYLFLSASKGKLFLFIKNLTFMKGSSLALKRFILDNVLSKWISNNFTNHISKPLKEWISYYKKLNLKSKLKKSLVLFLPASVIGVGMYFGGMLQSFALYAQLKVIIIGFFKFLWIAASKLFIGLISFVSGTWLAPIIEILALSWLLSWIEKIPFVGPAISKFFSNIGDSLGWIFSKFSTYFHKYIGRHFTSGLTKFGVNTGKYLNNKINYTKVKNEIDTFNNFEKKYLLKDVQKYFKGKQSRENKKKFYSELNIKSNDHFDIKAFIELDKSFDNIQDFFILEGFASCNETGSNHERINKKSFWVMNLNEVALVVFSKNNVFKPTFLSQNSLKLIQPKEDIDFNDIYIVDINQNKSTLITIINEEELSKEEFDKFIDKYSSDKLMLI